MTENEIEIKLESKERKRRGLFHAIAWSLGLYRIFGQKTGKLENEIEIKWESKERDNGYRVKKSKKTENETEKKWAKKENEISK